MKRTFIAFFLMVVTSISGFGQVSTNKEALLRYAEVKRVESGLKKQKAEQFAIENDIPIRIETDEYIAEIMEIRNGKPQYYITTNLGGARTARVDKVWPGGGYLNLGLTGSGYTAGIWDGGIPLMSHQEYTGRVTVMDGSTLVHYHPTHMVGSIIGSGIDPEAKGMAYQAEIESYNWDNDYSEMAAAAANGLLVSNHSYGYIRGWNYNQNTGIWSWYGDESIDLYEDFLFGFYDQFAREWDSIAYAAPKYLICKSGSNDRGQYNGAGPCEPDGGYDGYDCIAQNGVAKNILTVGAVREVPDYNDPSSVVMTSFSGWGPADDGRIKPDVVNKGELVLSCYSSNNSAYVYLGGTSPATSLTTGAMLLLQEYYMQSHGGDTMNSATLKGLVIHTADEAGPDTGPDYMFGWGLLNVEEAAALIKEDAALQNVIDEQILSNGNSYTRSVYASGNEPLKVTICWTDPPGTPVADQLDPDDPMLVNDLDLRVENAVRTVYYPWSLDKDNPTFAATNTGENNVDNVEQVYIENPPAGNYTITVDHDGILASSQVFSIIISGIDEHTSVPGCATLLNPSDGATGQPLTTTVEWDPVEGATAYDLYFGTDNPPTNIENGTTMTGTAYSPVLSGSTTYYIKVVPKNNQGPATGCPVWSFTTGFFTKVTTFPFTENYDSWSAIGTGNDWSDGTDDDFNWTIGQNGTPTSGTGPNGDHTSGSGKYLYIEVDPDNYPDKRADLYTPLFNMSAVTTPKLEFWYHMLGVDCGNLFVDIYTTGGWINGIWSRSGQQSSDGNDWKKAVIDLSPYSSSTTQQIRFRAVSNWIDNSDIAIDDINIQAASAMVVNSVTTVQGPTTAVNPDDLTQEIISVQINTSGVINPNEVTSFTFDTKGTVDPLDIANARLFFTGTGNTFSAENQVGNKFSPPAGEFTIDFVNQAILEEGTNYFWLVYDVIQASESCHYLDAECLSVTIDGTPTVPSVTDPPGNRRLQGFELVWADNFETDKGWTFGGEFERGAPQGLGGLSYGNPDPSTAYEGSNVIGSDLSGKGATFGDYEPNTPDRADSAVSPVIDCSGRTNVFIQFAMYLNVESPSWDHAYIEAFDGTNWNVVWENDSGYAFSDWQLVAFNVSSWADGNASFRVRFALGETDGFFQYSGWNVDDFRVYADADCSGGVPGLWTGGTSTDWSTGSNWDDGNVPTGTVDVIVGRMDHDPALDEVSSCNDLDIKDAGEVTLGTGTNLTVNGDFYNGHGLGASFTLNDGSVSVSGNYYSETGSSTTINGGTFGFTNWYRNPGTIWGKGNITLSGGTINASESVIWSAFDVTGVMDGPFSLNIGENFRMNDNSWTTITDGTITLTGSADDSVSCFASVFGTGSIKAHNLIFNAPGTTVLMNPPTDQTGVQILNDFTITSGDVFTTWSGFFNNYFDVDGNFQIGGSASFQHGAFSSTIGGTLDVDSGCSMEIDNGGTCTVDN